MGINLSHAKLQQLTAVARCGSFSRAAEDLHISQPALSRSIAAIERSVGFPIFNRIGHGVVPTSAGAQMLAQAEPLLQSLRVFDRNVGLLANGEAGKLQIGIPPLLASQILADLATEFFTPTSEIELRISIRSAPVLLEELKTDVIEFFLFAESQVEVGREIETTEIGSIEPTCVVRKNHSLSKRRGLTLHDLSAYPWASSVEPPAMGEYLSSSRFVCDNFNVLLEAVLATDLVCICSRAFVAQELADGSLCELDVPGFLPPQIPVFVAWLRGRVASPLAQAAIRRITTVLDEAKRANALLLTANVLAKPPL